MDFSEAYTMSLLEEVIQHEVDYQDKTCLEEGSSWNSEGSQVTLMDKKAEVKHRTEDLYTVSSVGEPRS